MPRGRKSKLQARQKRRQARGEPKSCDNPQATAAAEEESTPPSSPQHEGTSQSLTEAESHSTFQWLQIVPTSTTTPVGVCCPGCYEASNSADEDKEVSSEALLSTDSSKKDDFSKRAMSLELLLLYKYKMKQPILKEDMLMIIGLDYHDRFGEMLKTASEHIEHEFALDMIEVDSINPSYALVSKLKLPNNGRVRPGRGLPKTGLLLDILGIIFTEGNCASEEEIWRHLRLIRLYPGKRHFFFGEPRKLITKDFVRLKYLESRQVPGSDPPRYEFLWGPKAHLETTKMKVLEFWARSNNVHPSAFPWSYAEALRDEVERARARDAARVSTSAIGSAPSGPSGQQGGSTPEEVGGFLSSRPE